MRNSNIRMPPKRKRTATTDKSKANPTAKRPKRATTTTTSRTTSTKKIRQKPVSTPTTKEADNTTRQPSRTPADPTRGVQPSRIPRRTPIARQVNEQLIDDSTMQPSDNASNQDNVSLDPLNRLASILELSFKQARDSSLSDGNAKLVNRMTTAISLPFFSGDPLEWLNFKEVFEATTESGGYSDRGNIARLFAVLKGEARETVSTLLATTRDPKSVMDTLEMRYGDKNDIAERVANDLKTLPSIDSGNVTLAHFATKLRNAVATFKSFDLPGYLYHPDLIKFIGSQMPNALKYAYSRYIEDVSPDKTSELEILSDFLYAESKKTARTMIFNIDKEIDKRPETFVAKGKNQRRAKVNAIYNASDCEVKKDKNNYQKNKYDSVHDCSVCGRKNHRPMECRNLLAATVNKRWVIARKQKLCYKCLDSGHPRRSCDSEDKCSYCHSQSHHSLLHKRDMDNSASKSKHDEGRVNSAMGLEGNDS